MVLGEHLIPGQHRIAGAKSNHHSARRPVYFCEFIHRGIVGHNSPPSPAGGGLAAGMSDVGAKQHRFVCECEAKFVEGVVRLARPLLLFFFGKPVQAILLTFLRAEHRRQWEMNGFGMVLVKQAHCRFINKSTVPPVLIQGLAVSFL
jgi:hypothetical protein